MYYIAYITVTDNYTVLVEQSRPYDSLLRLKNHLQNTGFTYDEDLHCYINLETATMAKIYLEGARDPQAIVKREFKNNKRKRNYVKVVVNL